MIDMVIASKGRSIRLEKCVASILSNSVLLTVNVIVCGDADDTATRISVHKLNKIYPNRVIFVESPTIGSAVKAINAGFRYSKNIFVGGVPDDSYIDYYGWDTHAVQLFLENQSYDCLKLRTDTAGGRDECYGIPYPFTFIFKKDIFEKLGYLNEDYVHYGPDTHLGMQMVKEDILMMCSKNIVVKHEEIIDDATANYRKDNSIFPKDNLHFHAVWDSQIEALQAKYALIKDKWSKEV